MCVCQAFLSATMARAGSTNLLAFSPPEGTGVDVDDDVSAVSVLFPPLPPPGFSSRVS